jgi:hypothetical protein
MSQFPALSDDLLYGADAIARFVFGERDRRRNRRKIYALVETGQLPAFHLGRTICARKSSIVNSVAARERVASTLERAE